MTPTPTTTSTQMRTRSMYDLETPITWHICPVYGYRYADEHADAHAHAPEGGGAHYGEGGDWHDEHH